MSEKCQCCETEAWNSRLWEKNCISHEHLGHRSLSKTTHYWNTYYWSYFSMDLHKMFIEKWFEKENAQTQSTWLIKPLHCFCKWYDYTVNEDKGYTDVESDCLSFFVSKEPKILTFTVMVSVSVQIFADTGKWRELCDYGNCYGKNV